MSSITISSEDELRARLATDGPHWLFKHSNACGISSAAFAEYEQHLQEHGDQPAAHLIIQNSRPLSNLTAQLLGRVHQSPQVFLLRGDQVLWTATHWSITAPALAAAWNDHAP